MKFAVLLFEAEKYKVAPGSRMIIKRAREFGHTVSILRERDLQIRYNGKTRVLHRGKPLKRYDAIIVRPGIKDDPSIHAAIIRQIELSGQLVINGYLGVHRAKNKLRTLQLLSHFNLPIPKTAVIFSVAQMESAMNGFTYPVIIKSAYGSGGTGVLIAESKRALKPIVEYLLEQHSGNEPVKIQEYIKESKGKDIRVFVVGKKIVAAMERVAQRGEFRSNFHKGGKVKVASLSDEERRIAIEATQRMGLNIAGVDILRTKSGPVIIEMNSYPGLEGITKATGADIAGEIVKYTEQKVGKRRAKTGPRPVKEQMKNGEA